MKRIVNALGKLNPGKRACAVLALCATTAIALPAQTLTTLHSFDGADGGFLRDGVRRVRGPVGAAVARQVERVHAMMIAD